MSEKSINISLTKIMNYSEDNKDVQIHIGFYSKKTSALITKKSMKASCFNNCLDFAMNLKINFTQVENQVVIVVDEDQINSENPKYVGEVEVSLLELSKKKLKYYSLEKTDKILQIEVYQPKNYKKFMKEGENTKQKQPILKHHEQFIEERKKFLSKTIQTESVLKKAFSQRIFGLIKDSKSLKLNKNCGKSPLEQQKDLIQENQLDDIDQQSSSRLKKCRSDEALLNINLRKNMFFNQKTEKKESAHLNAEKQEEVQKFNIKQDY